MIKYKNAIKFFSPSLKLSAIEPSGRRTSYTCSTPSLGCKLNPCIPESLSMLLMLSFAVSVSTVCFLSDFSSFLIESKDVLYPASSAFSASISLAISSFSFYTLI